MHSLPHDLKTGETIAVNQSLKILTDGLGYRFFILR